MALMRDSKSTRCCVNAVEIGRRHDGVGLRHAPLVRLLARIEHVVVGRYVIAPIVQIAAHIIELAIILQAFLEFVARQQRVQVARLGCVGQSRQLPVPGQRVFLVVVEQAVEQISVADLFDRIVDPLQLRIEGIDGRIVVFGGLAGRRQLIVGVGHGEKRLLHRRVEQVAFAQREPGHQCALEFAHSRVRPTHAEQRLARVRTLEAYPLQDGFGFRRPLRLQQREPQREVGLVPERQQLLAARLDAPHPVQIRYGVGEAVLAHQRHAQVELGVGGPIGGTVPLAQGRDGVVVALLPHHQLCEQHVALGAEARVDLVGNLARGRARIPRGSRADTKPCPDRTTPCCAPFPRYFCSAALRRSCRPRHARPSLGTSRPTAAPPPLRCAECAAAARAASSRVIESK